MTTTQTSLTSLTTRELSGHLAMACEELSRRTDHDATELVRTLEHLGRSMGDLGRCLGASAWSPSTATHQVGAAPSAASCRTTTGRPRPSLVEPAAIPAPGRP